MDTSPSAATAAPPAVDPGGQRQVTRSRRARAWRFGLHYLEMVVAMVVGMIVLAPVWAMLWPGHSARADVEALVMATDMAVAMAAWMRFRGHGWAGIGEMCAAMYLPFAVLVVPYRAGAVTGEQLMTAGHVAMLPLMALVMLRRRHEH